MKCILIFRLQKVAILSRPWSVNHKQLETRGWVLRTIATDALVLKYQAIGIHSAE